MKSGSRAGRRWSAAVIIAVVGLLAVTAFAVAKSSTVGVGTAKVKEHKESIAVNSKGVAVYELLPETTHHPLCTSANQCFSFWPPVKVGAGTRLTKAAGVEGKLGTFKRDGFTQVTLNGHPLYTFSEDQGKRGEVEGEGLHSFRGVWHVFKEG
jgi:predicted lipoprotein with Yx(FWY)xxD motif